MFKDGEEAVVEEKEIQDPIESALNEENKSGEEVVAEKESVKEEEKSGEEAGKKEEEKKPEADPEFDLGLDEDGKTPLKFTRKQILEMKKSGMLQADYTKKTQEIAAERANLKEVADIIEYLKENPGKAERVIKILEEKEAEAKEEKLDLQKSLAELDSLLKDLPEDDPYAKVLRGQRTILQETLNTNKELSSKLEEITNGQKSDQESKVEAEAHQTLTEVMTNKQKSLEFVDEKEAAFWKRSVLSYLLNNRSDYSNLDKEKFAEYFNQVGDKVYAEITQIGEARVSHYIKKKGGAGLIPASAKTVLPAEKNKKPLNQDNLQEGLEAALAEEDGKEKT